MNNKTVTPHELQYQEVVTCDNEREAIDVLFRKVFGCGVAYTEPEHEFCRQLKRELAEARELLRLQNRCLEDTNSAMAENILLREKLEDAESEIEACHRSVDSYIDTVSDYKLNEQRMRVLLSSYKSQVTRLEQHRDSLADLLREVLDDGLLTNMNSWRTRALAAVEGGSIDAFAKVRLPDTDYIAAVEGNQSNAERAQPHTLDSDS